MFDLDGVKEVKTDFEPLPDGDYLCQVEAAESKRTKKLDGTYVKVTFSVLEGDYENRKIWHNFNTTNPNPQAVDIGLSQLKAFFVAAGVTDGLQFEDESEIATQLEGQSCLCTVRTKTREGYSPTNEITKFKPYEVKKTTTKVNPTTVRRRSTTKTDTDELGF